MTPEEKEKIRISCIRKLRKNGAQFTKQRKTKVIVLKWAGLKLLGKIDFLRENFGYVWRRQT